MSNNIRKLTLWVFDVILGERKVSITDFCRYIVDPFCMYLYGAVINTFIDILDAMKVSTVCSMMKTSFTYSITEYISYTAKVRVVMNQFLPPVLGA